jgi:hypothetical protein
VKPDVAQSASSRPEAKERNRSCIGIGPRGRAPGRDGFHHGLLAMSSSSEPPSPAPRRARAGAVIAWGLGLCLAAAAATGPALAEASVHAQLREHFAVDEGFAVDLDLAGLELRGFSRDLPEGRGHVRAERIRLRPGFEGLVLEIEGLDAVLRGRTPKRAKTESSRGSATPTKPGRTGEAKPKPKSAPKADSLARLLRRVRGVPIEIHTHGQVELELGRGLSAIATDPRAHLLGDGRIEGEGEFVLGSGSASSWARASLAFATTDANPRDLQVSGSLDLVSAPGPSSKPRPPLAITGRATPKAIELNLRERAGGRASVSVARRAVEGRDLARLEAEELPLELVEPLAQLFGRRLGDAIGERDGQIELDEARLSGVIELIRGAGLTRARFEAVEVSRLRLDSRLLSAKPIELEGLTIDGELAREHTPAGPRSFGALVLGHAGVQVELAGQLDPAGLSFDLQVPRMPCQALLDATPGISPVLAGTELRGEMAAHFGLDLDFAALARARERYLGEDAEHLELEDFEAPGELRFDLPYLEQCTVERLGPGADVAGLRGPYHHTFVSAAGVETRRVLALGDADYVPLDRVPNLALAFVILEDARFWDHDGFDREQIERAFWYNLLEGRVSRGASTISQQAARSLWLGVDRSLTRKLAEAVLAAELERELDKQRILEVYLNIIELGPEVHGVVEAARYHFGKAPEELELIEALHLASMAPAPVAYSRRFAAGRIDRKWRKHLRRQVRRLRIRHLISAAEAEAAMRLDLRLRAHPELAPATHRDP